MSILKILFLTLLGCSILVVCYFLVFEMGHGTGRPLTGRPLGVIIGGMLYLFFSVLYSDPPQKV